MKHMNKTLKGRIGAVVMAAAMAVSVAAVPTFAAGNSLVDAGQTIIDTGTSAGYQAINNASNTAYTVGANAYNDGRSIAQTGVSTASNLFDTAIGAGQAAINNGQNFVYNNADQLGQLALQGVDTAHDAGMTVASDLIGDAGSIVGDIASQTAGAVVDTNHSIVSNAYSNGREVLRSVAGLAGNGLVNVGKDAVNLGLAGMNATNTALTGAITGLIH